MDALVLKAIQKEPENRFQSMNEMKQALLAVSAQLGKSPEAKQAEESVQPAQMAPPVQAAVSTQCNR